MKLKSIIRLTSYYDLTPFSESELIKEVKRDIGYIIASIAIADIEITSALLKEASNGNLLRLLELIPNVTERIAADIIDGSIIIFDLQEDLFDEAIDATKELKANLKLTNKEG